MSLVNGLHHVALKCVTAEEYEEVKKFYGEILGIPVAREWKTGIMFETGAGIIEIFNTGDEVPEDGPIRHFAFATDDPDACIEAVRKAGYPVTREPSDVVIPAEPAFPIRVAFCRGPLGEEIEFFKERM